MRRPRRTRLAAACLLLLPLAVPAAAQAHHTTLTASCVVEGSAPVVKYRVQFVGFSAANAKTSITGSVKVDGATARSVPPADQVTWSGDNGTLAGSVPGTPGAASTVVSKFKWLEGTTWHDEPAKSAKTGVCADPGIAIDKQGPATAYVGDQATFTYAVRNTGNVKLSSPDVSDDKCAPVSKVPDGQSSFDPGDVWIYTCTTTITDAMGDELVNVGTACAEWANPDGPDPEVCDEDTHTTEIPKPAILLDKTGAATAVAGSTYTYSFTATNTGNVALGDVVLSDPKCADTLERVEPGLADATFDPGDAWHYTCTVTAPAGPAQVDNLAEVCGTFAAPDVRPATVCDDDPHTFTVPPPGEEPPVDEPPVDTPPAGKPPVGGEAPDGEVLPVATRSGRARLLGPSGCLRQAFRARVSGREITSVTFTLDGRVLKRIKGKRATYSVRVQPNRYGFGRHKLVARVTFTNASGTKARKLPLTFRRCAQGPVAPRFTG